MPEHNQKVSWTTLLSTSILASSVVENEGLIPLNPTKLSGFIGSCAIQSNPRIQQNNVMQAFENVEQTFEFLNSAHNTTHYADRLKKVGFDTAIVNAACEMLGALGTIVVGSYANQMAEEIFED